VVNFTWEYLLAKEKCSWKSLRKSGLCLQIEFRVRNNTVYYLFYRFITFSSINCTPIHVVFLRLIRQYQTVIFLLKPKTLCTTSCNRQKFCILPTMQFMCFAWISEQRAIISLYNINLAVFISEAESVYCAVRTGPLNQTARVWSLKG